MIKVILLQEFALRKRLQMKDLHTTTLNGLREQAQLPAEQADWLLKVHFTPFLVRCNE